MKTKTQATLVAVLLAIATALAAGCGSSASPPKPVGNPTDRAFIQEMVPHHTSAVQMATVAETEATGTFVKNLAANIVRSQRAEINQMRRIDQTLAAAGIKTGKLGSSAMGAGMRMDAGTLRGAKPFDAKFIAMMLPHHASAIQMARVEQARGADPELKRLAAAIIKAQSSEIAQMRAQPAAS